MRCFLSAAFIFASAFVFANANIPLIKANSKKVDIRDENVFRKNAWNIEPQAKPDVYTTTFSKKPRKVTFYTDVDSISFTVKPNDYILFNILLNNKDTALTAIYSYDTLGTLKKAGKYNYKEVRQEETPVFSYQPADNANLVALRKAFNLDSVAGQANEVSKIINLLDWVHNLIPHDGGHNNPVVKNALSMIAECKRDNRGLNCRGLATVLNECYLAMGIPSRFVTCLPKDSLGIDNDCHVINMVYVKDLKKWIWIDPTFDAYVMNEKGDLLGIEEVRERIIDGRPMHINPGANWNHKISQVKEDYLYSYMAKNLYILECPLSSEYDTETMQPGKKTSYLKLIPLDYFKKTIGTGISTNNINKTVTVTYRTNNPNLFWAAPAN